MSRSFTPICCDSPVVSDMMSCRLADMDAIICEWQTARFIPVPASNVIPQTVFVLLAYI